MSGSSSGESDEDDWGEYASPPCFMHELDASFQLDASCRARPKDLQQDRDVAQWRKSERERLVAARLALAPEEKADQDRRIAGHLDEILAFATAPLVVGAYWPIRGEPDLRSWMAAACAKGARIALPSMTEASKRLIFREWRPDLPLKRGYEDVPVPEEIAGLIPAVIIAPGAGFDRSGFRLGNGDGFLDRTLAAIRPKPLAIGVAYSNALIRTIYPQTYDVPMDWIVTGSERFRVGSCERYPAPTGSSKTT